MGAQRLRGPVSESCRVVQYRHKRSVIGGRLSVDVVELECCRYRAGNRRRKRGVGLVCLCGYVSTRVWGCAAMRLCVWLCSGVYMHE